MRNKKVIVLTMCACLGAITSLAQPREGTFSIVPHIGVSLANMGNNSILYSVDSNNQRAYDSRYKAGFDGGVDFFYQAGQRQAVSLGVEYQMMGYRYPDLEQVDADEIHTGWSEQRLTSGYLAVPLKAHYYLVKGLSVNAGVQVGFLLHAKYHQVESNFYYDKEGKLQYVQDANGNIQKDVETDSDVKDAYNKVDVSIPIGVSYEFMNVVAGVRYNLSFTKANKLLNGKNRCFVFTVGYKFNFY